MHEKDLELMSLSKDSILVNDDDNEDLIRVSEIFNLHEPQRQKQDPVDWWYRHQ